MAWPDTDAAGIWHHSTAARWMEEAEAELHRRLGIIDETFGNTPRVNLQFDFRTPLHFEDEVDIAFAVMSVGDTSVTYEMTGTRDGVTAVTARMTTVLIDGETGAKRSWPDHLRRALEGSGSRSGSRSG